MTTHLDFLEQFHKAVLGVVAPNPIMPKDVLLGGLIETPCVGILTLPSGEETVFMDGARDKIYSLSVHIQHEYDGECNTYLTDLYRHIERIKDIPSENGSYGFIKAKTSNLPNKVGVTEKKLNVWELNFQITIHIYKGVDE